MTRAWQPLMTSAGGVEYFFRDNEDGTYTVWSTQENDPFLERNKVLQNAGDRGYTSASKEFRREGSVPLGLIQHWRETEGVNVLHPSGHDFLRKKLNDSDWRGLRTSEGKT
jgi:hypothetical protein